MLFLRYWDIIFLLRYDIAGSSFGSPRQLAFCVDIFQSKRQLQCRSSSDINWVYITLGLRIQHTRVGNRFGRSTLIIKMHQLREYTSVQHWEEMQQEYNPSISHKHPRQCRTTINSQFPYYTCIKHIGEMFCRVFFLSFLLILLSAEGENLTERYESFPADVSQGANDPPSESFALEIDPYTSIPSSSRLSALESRRRRLRRRNSLHQTDARFTRRLAEIGGGR